MKYKARKPTQAITYRLDIIVKQAINELAMLAGRSENNEAELLLKIGYLHRKGVNVYGMNDLQIAEKFNELTANIEIAQ